MSKRLSLADLKKARDHGVAHLSQAQQFALWDFAIGHFHEDEQFAAAKPKAR